MNSFSEADTQAFLLRERRTILGFSLQKLKMKRILLKSIEIEEPYFQSGCLCLPRGEIMDHTAQNSKFAECYARVFSSSPFIVIVIQRISHYTYEKPSKSGGLVQRLKGRTTKLFFFRRTHKKGWIRVEKNDPLVKQGIENFRILLSFRKDIGPTL